MDRRVLVVDDDRLIREMSRDALAPHGFRVSLAASGDEALSLLASEGPFDVVLTDLSMRGIDGLQLLEHVKRGYPRCDVIIVTAYASLESALEAMRLGAADYLRKPVRPPEILYCVQRVLLRRGMEAENDALRASLQAFEDSRVLATCLEGADLVPLAIQLLQRLLRRERTVGRLLHPHAAHGDGVWVLGFKNRRTEQIRALAEQGKGFDPAELGAGARSLRRAPDDALRRLGIDDVEWLGLPLRLDGRVVGGIWLLSGDRPFEAREIERAELVIGQAELALVNADRFLQAREKAFIDDTSDLYNARYLFAALDRELARARRSGSPLSVLFLDLDRFKQVNDRHGHLVGSRVLREFGHLLLRSVRTIDTVARYGGDEFTILLVDSDHDAALHVAERIRQMVEQHSFGAEAGVDLHLSCCIGAATFPLHADAREALIDLADKAMYRGKSLGRNRVCSVAELVGAGDASDPFDRTSGA
jgi:diguanylate cyclase (GGDEF)-like protein